MELIIGLPGGHLKALVSAGAGPSVTEDEDGVLERIRRTRLIAVLRGIDEADASPVVDALLAAGVEALEFTADTADAMALIRREGDRVGDRAAVGVGTVMDPTTAEEAIEAGAAFIVTPTVVPAVIEVGVAEDRPVVAGAFTPTEAVRADEAGAAMVKVFPAETGGPAHIGAFSGPLDYLDLVPTGGITVDTAGSYIANGATAVAVGGGLRPKGAIEAGDYRAVQSRAEALLVAVKRSR